MVGPGAAEFAPALREALDLHVLVRSDNAIGFRHVLIADAVYGELLGVERTELHRRWAGELESVPAAVPRLAYHWYEAGEYEPAFDASLTAARDAGAVLAFDSAYHHFRRALAVWDRVANPAARAGSSRVDLCLAAAEAANWSGDPAAAVGMIDVALALPEADDPEWGSVLLERRGWYLLRHGENAAAREAYESALATLPVTAEPAVRTRVLAGSVRAYERAADFDRALELAREAVTIAVETEASTEIGPAHYMLGRILLTIGEVDGALTELDQAARAAEETLNPVMLAIALLERGDALARRRQLADAVPAALDAAARLRARGYVDPFALLATASAAALLNRLGRPAEGRALAAEILTTARSPVTLAVGHLLAGAFDVEALRVEAAREHLDTARFLAAPLLDGRVGAALATARAELALVDGNATNAMGAVEEGLGRVAHTGDDEAYAHLCLLGLRIEAERNALTLGRASERSQRHRDAKVDELERGLQRVLDAWPAGADRPDLAAIRSGWTAERTRLDGAPDPAASGARGGRLGGGGLASLGRVRRVGAGRSAGCRQRRCRGRVRARRRARRRDRARQRAAPRARGSPRAPPRSCPPARGTAHRSRGGLGGNRRRADRARTRGARPRSRRRDEPPDRGALVHQPEDRQRARVEDSHQARCRGPRGSGGPCPAGKPCSSRLTCGNLRTNDHE